MSANLVETALSVLERLLIFADQGTPPDEARAILRRAIEGSGAKVEIFSEREPFAGSHHYDALLRIPGEGAVSLGVCGDAKTPWNLRGSFRWNETELLRVNDQRVSVQEIMSTLELTLANSRIQAQLINRCLVREYMKTEWQGERTVTTEELQEAVDAFRTRHGLFSVEATERWLSDRGLEYEALERMAEDRALVARLRREVAGIHVEAYFDVHRAELDAIDVAALYATSELSAAGLVQRLEGGEPLAKVALDASLAFLGSGAANPDAIVRRVRRLETSGAGAQALERLFDEEPGRWSVPTPCEEGFVIFGLLRRVPARLDEDTRAWLEAKLFSNWLSELRQNATIEWTWGASRRES